MYKNITNYILQSYSNYESLSPTKQVIIYAKRNRKESSQS